MAPANKPYAVIPARGGSKRIPRKNIRPFLKRPLISYPIAAALRADVFSHVIVSTDCEEIAAVAREHGAEVPFMRPSELADDFASIVDVLLHAAHWADDAWGPSSPMCCLFPGAVFVTPELIRQGLESLYEQHATSVFTVAKYETPILRALTRDDTGFLRMLWPEYEMSRSQDLPEAYYDVGQMYWIDVAAFYSERRVYTKKAFPLELPPNRAQDIDTESDWALAEMKYSLWRKQGNLDS